MNTLKGSMNIILSLIGQRPFRKTAHFVLLGVMFVSFLGLFNDNKTESSWYSRFVLFKSVNDDDGLYHFGELTHSFARIDLMRVQNIKKHVLENQILDSLPLVDSIKANLYIHDVLAAAEKYQVDPFWAVSVMWVESRFEDKATSVVNARGLMQIMPSTGRYLAKLLGKEGSEIGDDQFHFDTKANIEMGVFYLRLLLIQFNYDYKRATVAYNMGPVEVRRRIASNLPVGTDNNYLKKVSAAYLQLTKTFRPMILSPLVTYNRSSVHFVNHSLDRYIN